MNRELWFRLLQVGVIAPYIYKLSAESKSQYFGIGLKMVAGSIVIMNIKPIMSGLAPVIKILADAALQMQKQNAVPMTIDKTNVIEGDFTEKKPK